jgi:hypothetical protein
MSLPRHLCPGLASSAQSKYASEHRQNDYYGPWGNKCDQDEDRQGDDVGFEGIGEVDIGQGEGSMVTVYVVEHSSCYGYETVWQVSDRGQ